MMLKKISALLLALAMVLAVAVPAFAALPPEGEGIEPQYESICRMCGKPTTLWRGPGYSIHWNLPRACDSGASGCSGDYAASYAMVTTCGLCGNILNTEIIYPNAYTYCPKTGVYY